MAERQAKLPAKKKAAARPASERAQEDLDRATRVEATAADRLAKAKVTVTELEAELVKATKRREYAALNPDLPTPAVEVAG